MTYTEQQLADLYGLAVSAELEEKREDAYKQDTFALDEAVLQLAPGGYAQLIRTLIDQLRAAGRRPQGETPAPELVASHIATMEAEGDMIAVPRGLLGTALGAISHPAHTAGMTTALLKAYAYGEKQKPVAQVYQPANVGICAPLGPSVRMLTALKPGTNLYTAAQLPQPAVVPDGWDAYNQPKSDDRMMIPVSDIVEQVQQAATELQDKAEEFNTGLSWEDYRGISSRADVHDAVQNLMGDTTEDNAISLVRAIAEALRPRPRFWLDMHGFRSELFTSEAEAVASCNNTGGLYVLPLFAGEPINAKLPVRMCRPADEPQTIEVSPLLRNLQAIPQRYTSDHVSLAEVFAVIEALRGAK